MGKEENVPGPFTVHLTSQEWERQACLGVYHRLLRPNTFDNMPISENMCISMTQKYVCIFKNKLYTFATILLNSVYL